MLNDRARGCIATASNVTPLKKGIHIPTDPRIRGKELCVPACTIRGRPSCVVDKTMLRQHGDLGPFTY